MNLDAAAFIAEADLLLILKDRSRPVDCFEEHVLFCQGDEPAGLYIVHEGAVRVTMCDAGGERVVDFFARPNSLLGLPGLVSNSAYSLSATAFPGAEVSYVAREEFSQLMLSQPGFAMMILRVLAAEVRTARMAACKR